MDEINEDTFIIKRFRNGYTLKFEEETEQIAEVLFQETNLRDDWNEEKCEYEIKNVRDDEAGKLCLADLFLCIAEAVGHGYSKHNESNLKISVEKEIRED